MWQVRLGRLLSSQPRFDAVPGSAVALNDVWMAVVVPLAVGRGYAPPEPIEAPLGDKTFDGATAAEALCEQMVALVTNYSSQ